MSSAHLGRGRAEGEECRSEVRWGGEKRGGIRGASSAGKWEQKVQWRWWRPAVGWGCCVIDVLAVKSGGAARLGCSGVPLLGLGGERGEGF